MLVLAPTEIKQKQLYLEASRWKSQDGWASSPSSSNPHTLWASLFPGTRVEVLGVPWRAKCLDFFHPLVVDSLHDIYTYIRWKVEMLFHETHTYSALQLFWESGKGSFCMDTQKKLSGRCFYILINILYITYLCVILYFPSYFLSFSPSCSSCLSGRSLTGGCRHLFFQPPSWFISPLQDHPSPRCFSPHAAVLLKMWQDLKIP